jgi:hypothetical protein
MEQGDRGSERCEIGGIISLAQFAEEHGGALNYDLMTRTVYQLDDVGGSLSWTAHYSFIRNLGSNSALAKDLGKSTGWEDTTKTNAILADIYDLLQVINANLIAYASGGKQKRKIKPYPRPGKEGNKNERKIGKDAMPVTDLREWIRRKQHG